MVLLDGGVVVNVGIVMIKGKGIKLTCRPINLLADNLLAE
jgi:hypothetical protein